MTGALGEHRDASFFAATIQPLALNRHPAALHNETALEPTAIAALQQRIKAMAPARLEGFSKGFRAAFQVPDAQPSLAGLITSTKHQRWIEGFLAESATA